VCVCVCVCVCVVYICVQTDNGTPLTRGALGGEGILSMGTSMMVREPTHYAGHYRAETTDTRYEPNPGVRPLVKVIDPFPRARLTASPPAGISPLPRAPGRRSHSTRWLSVPPVAIV